MFRETEQYEMNALGWSIGTNMKWRVRCDSEVETAIL